MYFLIKLREPNPETSAMKANITIMQQKPPDNEG